MKRAVAAIATTGTIIAAGYFGVRMTEPKPSPAIARVTATDMSATAKVGATKEETWQRKEMATQTAGVRVTPAPANSPTAGVPPWLTNSTKNASGVATVSIAPTAGESSLSTDPYRYSMTDPNAGPVKECDRCPTNQNQPSVVVIVTATTPMSATATPPKKVAKTTLGASTASVAASDPGPGLADAPAWARCTTSWKWVEAVNDAGMLSWKFTTTLSDADVQDLATSVAWWASIRKNYPETGMRMAWIDCAGFRVADFHAHGAGMRPVDYFGSIGLDSPLGTCHGIVEFTPAGLLPSTTRGLVCVLGKFCVVATIDAPRCPQGVCSAHFDRPCVLLEADDYPVWVGGNTDDAKERAMWGVK